MKIRKLKWNGVGDRVTAPAFGIDVFYLVQGEPGDWTLTSPHKTQYMHTPQYETQRAAQAAAQVDFERRVRAEVLQS